VRGSALFHGIRIISWPTVLARAGLTVGCFPHVRC
jgi:hypothetical protein